MGNCPRGSRSPRYLDWTSVPAFKSKKQSIHAKECTSRESNPDLYRPVLLAGYYSTIRPLVPRCAGPHLAYQGGRCTCLWIIITSNIIHEEQYKIFHREKLFEPQCLALCRCDLAPATMYNTLHSVHTLDSLISFRLIPHRPMPRYRQNNAVRPRQNLFSVGTLTLLPHPNSERVILISD